MALKATVFKAELNIADMDRHYYQTHSLTLAQHPSETDERLMVRVLAFALHASESLAFTRGISTDDEPDLWQKTLTDDIELWVDLGQPDEKRIRKACARAGQVVIYTYQPRSAAVWWEQSKGVLARFDNLRVRSLDADTVAGLARLTGRSMTLHATIQDGQVWLANESESVAVGWQEWQSPAAGNGPR